MWLCKPYMAVLFDFSTSFPLYIDFDKNDDEFWIIFPIFK